MVVTNQLLKRIDGIFLLTEIERMALTKIITYLGDMERYSFAI